MENEKNNPCCPELVEGKKCDYLDLVYRLNNFTDVKQDNQNQRVAVEIAIHVRIERCTGPLQLGNVVYSTTLLPGEKVRLFTHDHRSRFSFDSESQLSYRHEQSAEEQFYMESYEKFMSDLDSRENIHSSSSSSGSASSKGSTSGLFGTIINGPSASISGSFDASSTKDFIRELSIHAEASHNKSVQMTRESSAVQVGEVQTKRHTEGESESHIESSSRTFNNTNRCHSVSYLFYQVDKQQTTKVSIKTIKTRVIDPVASSAVVNNPINANPKFSIIPAAVLATSDKAIIKTREFDTLQQENATKFQSQFAVRSIRLNAAPISVDVRKKALENVKKDLIENKILNKEGGITKEILSELSFDFSTSIPTPGVVVKGCLDDCNICEDSQKELVGLELENQHLQNKLLAKQIELLEKSQEYRCCPVDEIEEDES
ncbi:MAG: hypothetical protein ABFR32_06930 [Bacteroidota bacterium]